MDARKEQIAQVNAQFDEAVDKVRDPGKSEREQAALEANPLFAAGIRGLDRLKWDFQGAQMTAQRLQEQGL